MRRPRATVAAALIACAVSVISGLTMEFRSDVVDLAPDEVREAIRDLEQVFGVSDHLFLILSAEEEGAEECLIAFARTLESILDGDERIRSVSYGWGDEEERLLRGEFLSRAPLYARGADLDELASLLTPEGMRRTLEKQLAFLDLPGVSEAARWVENDPLELRRFLLPHLRAASLGFRFQTGRRVFLSEDGRALLVRIAGRVSSADMGAVRSFMTSVFEAVEAARASSGLACAESVGAKGVDVAWTGGYALALESQEVMRADLIRNITLSLALVFSLLLLSWRNARVFLAAGCALSAGMLGGFGLFRALRAEIVTLALVSGAILAAIAIDFSIHLVEPLRARAWSPGRAPVLEAVRLTGKSLLFAALTTVIGFTAFGLAGGGFLRDMGILTACGIAATFLATLTVFPAILALIPVRGDRAGKRRQYAAVAPGRLASACGSLAARHPRVALGAAGAVSVIAITGVVLRPPAVERDLRRIHATDSPAIAARERLYATFGVTEDPVLLLVTTERPSRTAWPVEVRSRGSLPPGEGSASETELVRRLHVLSERLVRLVERGDLAGFSSPAHFLPNERDQNRVLELLRSQDRDRVLEQFDRQLEGLGFAPGALSSARDRLGEALDRRAPLTAGELRDLGFREHLDAMLRSSGGTSWALVSVYPAVPGWNHAEWERLLQELAEARRASGLAGTVTGLHAASLKSAEFIVEEFLRAVAIALGAVALLVLVLFRDPILSLCAMIPVVLGCLVLFFLWGGLGLRINFMNVGILPMIIGIGIDDGIHLVARYRRSSDRDVAGVLRSTGAAVVLTTLTTLLAFGTLAFSVNRGLASVGWLAALGVSLCLAASLFVLPALLELHRRNVPRD